MLRRVVAVLLSAVVLAALLVLVPAVIPTDWARKRVADGVSAATGLTVEFAGPSHYRLLPRPALLAADVRLMAGDRALLQLQEASVEVTPQALVAALGGAHAPTGAAGAMLLTGKLTPADGDAAAEVQATVAAPAELAGGGSSAVALTVTSATGRVTADGQLGLAPFFFGGTAEADLPALAALAKRFGTAMPPLAAGHLAGKVSARATRVELADGRLTSPAGDASLAVAVDLGQERPAWDAHVEAGRIDLAAASALFGPVTGLMSLDGLDRMDAGLAVKLGRIDAGAAMLAEDVDAVAVAKDGTLRLVINEARLAGGRLTGSADLGKDADGRSLAASVRISDAEAAALTPLVAGSGLSLGGRLGGDLRLQSRGRTAEELLAGLDARARVELAAGSVAGLPLAGVFGDAAAGRVDGIGATAEITGLGRPVTLTGQGTFRGAPLPFRASVDPVALLGGAPSGLSLAMGDARFGLRFDGDLDPADPGVSGSLEISARTVAGAAAFFNRTADIAGDSGFVMTGTLDGGPAQARLSDLSLMLGENRVTGLIDWRAGAADRLYLRLAADRADVAALMPLMAFSDVAAAGRAAVEVVFDARRLTAGPVSADSARVELQLTDVPAAAAGKLTVTLGPGRVAGLDMTKAVTAWAAGQPVALAAQGSGGGLAFDRLTARGRLDGGKIVADSLAIDAGALQAGGTLTADLAAGRIEGRLSPRFPAAGGAGAVEPAVPLTLSGAFGAIELAPSGADFLPADGVKAVLKGLAGERPAAASGTGGDAIGSMIDTLGSAPAAP